MEDLCLCLKNRLDELDGLNERLTGIAEAMGMAPKALFEVQLAVEELFTNIVSYAYDDEGEHDVFFDISGSADTLVITIRDRGKPFDPLKAVEPDVHANADERPVGKLGIFFARKVMDSFTYERKDGANVVTVKKNLT